MINRVSRGSSTLEVAVSIVAVMVVAIGMYSLQHTPAKDQSALNTVLIESASTR
jgi:hypothetical protein